MSKKRWLEPDTIAMIAMGAAALGLFNILVKSQEQSKQLSTEFNEKITHFIPKITKDSLYSTTGQLTVAYDTTYHLTASDLVFIAPNLEDKTALSLTFNANQAFTERLKDIDFANIKTESDTVTLTPRQLRSLNIGD